MYADLLDIGDRATWRTINGKCSGIVTGIDDMGVWVALDGGGQMLLSTTRSMEVAKEKRNHNKKNLIHQQHENKF